MGSERLTAEKLAEIRNVCVGQLRDEDQHYGADVAEDLLDHIDAIEADLAASQAREKALDWVVTAAKEVDEGAVHSGKPYYDLVHTYAMESFHAALAELDNPEVDVALALPAPDLGERLTETLPDVRTIVETYLSSHGFGGLCGDECGCATGEMFLCGSNPDECQPAYAYDCRGCNGEDECRHGLDCPEPGEYTSFFSTKKPTLHPETQEAGE